MCHSKQGSRAGCATGDLLFSVAFAQVCKRLHAVLCTQNLVPTYEVPAPVVGEWYGDLVPTEPDQFRDASWADDMGRPVVAPASHIIPKLRATAVLTHQVMLTFGFECNFAPGKTAAVIAWAGPLTVSYTHLTLPTTPYV